MSDTWTHIMRALSKDYDASKAMLEAGPKPKCIIGTKGRQTVVTIVERWEDSGIISNLYTPSNKLNEYVEWSTEQLETWQGVKRMSYDQWYFKRRADAEKFITFFMVKWAE